MEKYIYDEKNGLHYELVGDYYLPPSDRAGSSVHRYLGTTQTTILERALSGNIYLNASI